MDKEKGVVLIVCIVLLFMVSSSCERQHNPVLDYLDGAELQYEGDAQRENIIAALEDVLHLSPEVLQGKRYRDYQGNENVWDLRTVIARHFVPRSKDKMLGLHFHHDITSKEVKSVVAEILENLRKKSP